MKTTTALCALTLLAGVFAANAQAEATVYIPRLSTIPRLAEQAECVVVGKLARVENVKLNEPGIDFTTHPAKGVPSRQDGISHIRREAVITVTQTLKGQSFVAGGELRVVSLRQIQFDNYDADMRTGDCLYFTTRRADGNLMILSEERGAISASDNAGSLAPAVDLARRFIEASAANFDARFSAIKSSLLSLITLNGSRAGLDACIELAWNWEDYAASVTAADKQTLLNLAKQSAPGSSERVELIHAVGRHKPDGALQDLLGVLLSDGAFNTTSITAWAMESVDRRPAVDMMIAAFDGATTGQKMLLVRALGLVQPKASYEGADVRTAACNCVAGLLVASSDETVLREALIAARNMWAGKELTSQLKNLIDNRSSNGISDEALKGAIVALATSRVKVGEGLKAVDVIFERSYLNNLAAEDPTLKQVVDCALIYPYTMLINDIEGRLR